MPAQTTVKPVVHLPSQHQQMQMEKLFERIAARRPVVMSIFASPQQAHSFYNKILLAVVKFPLLNVVLLTVV
jgi:hypothetical protein